MSRFQKGDQVRFRPEHLTRYARAYREVLRGKVFYVTKTRKGYRDSNIETVYMEDAADLTPWISLSQFLELVPDWERL